MIKVCENKKQNAESYPILVDLNIGELFFTVRSAKELRDKLSSVVANIERKDVV